MKKILTILLVATLALVLLTGCTQTQDAQPELDDNSAVQTTETVSTETNELTQTEPSEKEKYAKFEAELTCELISVNDETDFVQAMQTMEEISTKYNYTEAEITELKEKYEDDSELRGLILEEMSTLCPESMEEIQ